MDLDRLHHKLIAAARALPPSDAVPYRFERRIMACLESLATIDPWSVWGRALWRAAVPCLAVMCGVAVWSAVVASPVGMEVPLAMQFESTLLGPLVGLQEAW